MSETTSAARIAPAAETPQMTEHLSLLVTPEMRAFLLGSKQADNARSEGTVARALLDDAIEAFRRGEPGQYAARLKAGRRELARRARGRA
jgi:hypothetical protein